jgi:hypothetical protein
MIKKGNKTQYHNMEVPMTSDFANQVYYKHYIFFDIYLMKFNINF